MPTTPKMNLPYPVATDTPDVPRDIKALADVLDAALSVQPHGVYFRNPDAVPSGAAEVVGWSGVRSQQGMNSAGTNIVITTPGVYVMTAFVQWAANAAGRRTLTIKQNGNPRAVDTRAVADTQPIGQTVTVGFLAAANDTITVETYQNSGATLATPEGVTATVFKVSDVKA